jgi:CubicO group peptidase (beta-lactamase class C family)
MQTISNSSTIDFNSRAAPEAVGMSAAGVQRIAEVFDGQIRQGLHPGAQLVVLRHGQVVIDQAAGLADVRRRRPVTAETPFITFSVTKAFTAVCVHRLIEEGKIEWDAPVARYWPEFGRNGKDQATIRHVFLHQAGIPSRGLVTQVLRCQDWERVTAGIASLDAEFRPGDKTAYHAVSYGYILGEVVRRMTGMRIEDYLRETLLTPLRLERTWLGLPAKELGRAARLYPGCMDQRIVVLAFNLAFIRQAAMPAATLHSTARDLAVFYQMLLNGGEYAGQRYLLPETVAAATALGWQGLDETMGRPVRWAHGFHLGGLQRLDPGQEDGMGKGSTEQTFGHFGQRTCMVWADWAARLVVAFTSNRMLSRETNLARWQAISNAVWEAVL